MWTKTKANEALQVKIIERYDVLKVMGRGTYGWVLKANRYGDR